MSSRFFDQVDALARKSAGTVGVYAERLDTGEQLSYNADQIFPSASVVKLPVLFELFRQIRDKQISLDERIELRDENKVIGSGVLKELHAGLLLTLQDLAIMMMSISDNTAANIVMDRVGIKNVNRTMSEVGLSATRVTGKILIDQTHKTDTETGKGELSPTSAIDLVCLLKHIERREYLGAENSERLLSILRRVQTDSVIARGLPREQLHPPGGEPKIAIAHKTGTLYSKGVRANAGLVYLPDFTYAIALLSKGFPDWRNGHASDVNALLGEISRIAYCEFVEHG